MTKLYLDAFKDDAELSTIKLADIARDTQHLMFKNVTFNGTMIDLIPNITDVFKQWIINASVEILSMADAEICLERANIIADFICWIVT